MNDRIKEAMLVLEHHRALFRYKNAQNERERAVFKEQVKTAEANLRAYEEGLNGKGVQDTQKADNTGKASPTLCFVRRADKEGR